MMKRNYLWIGITLLLWTGFMGCEKSQQINEAEEKSKIMALHKLQRTYHFEKMAKEFAEQLSPNHISVNRGQIKSPTQEEHIKRFQNYFNSVEFEKWDDVSPPVIRFSDDYSLAYTIVDKEVIVKYEDEEGNLQRELTPFSWVAIYKRYPDGWKIDCVASTNKSSKVLNENE